MLISLSAGVADRHETHRPIRWGIMGSGMIASDYVGALQGLPAGEAEVVAVGARSLGSAEAFAREHSVARAYEGYEAVAADPEVDVIYVATVAQAHVACARLALAAGKPVLVEKPLALCASDAKALAEEARHREVFLMEGMWTRCFPALRRAQELLRSGAIGEVTAVSADFGWPADPLGEHKRTLDPVSGGVCLDVAMYPIAHVLLAAGAAEPTNVVAAGTAKAASNGEGRVDWTVGAALSGFPRAPALTATILCTLDGSTPEEVVFTGTKGTLRIERPAHAPSRLRLSVASCREKTTEEQIDFPLPPAPEGALPFNYPGSQGFLYEAEAVHAALRAGRLQSDEWTHEESITTQAIIDRMRAAVIAGAA